MGSDFLKPIFLLKFLNDGHFKTLHILKAEAKVLNELNQASKIHLRNVDIWCIHIAIPLIKKEKKKKRRASASQPVSNLA